MHDHKMKWHPTLHFNTAEQFFISSPNVVAFLMSGEASGSCKFLNLAHGLVFHVSYFEMENIYIATFQVE